MFCDGCGALQDDGTLICSVCGREQKERQPVVRPVAEWGADAVPVEVPEPEVAVAPEHPCPKHPEMPVAGTCPRCGTFVCIRCAPEAALGKLECEACRSRVEQPTYERIGGWLILSAISLIVSLLGEMVVVAVSLLSGDVASVALYGALLGVTLVLTINFFRRRSWVPLAMVFYVLASGAISVFEGRWFSIVFSVLWASYFLRSERVKRTFVVGAAPRSNH